MEPGQAVGGCRPPVGRPAVTAGAPGTSGAAVTRSSARPVPPSHGSGDRCVLALSPTHDRVVLDGPVDLGSVAAVTRGHGRDSREIGSLTATHGPGDAVSARASAPPRPAPPPRPPGAASAPPRPAQRPPRRRPDQRDPRMIGAGCTRWRERRRSHSRSRSRE
jgi:hypothetical protein